MNNFYLRFNHTIWQNDELTLSQRLIVNFVWNFQLKSGAAYASDEYIAEVFNMSVDMVRTLVAELISNGHIKLLEKTPRRLMIVNSSLYPTE
jgi:hypothetical protein